MEHKISYPAFNFKVMQVQEIKEEEEKSCLIHTFDISIAIYPIECLKESMQLNGGGKIFQYLLTGWSIQLSKAQFLLQVPWVGVSMAPFGFMTCYSLTNRYILLKY